MKCLVVCVRFHEGRYHGVGDWPPSPARLFQALIAGAASGGVLAADDAAALRWMEELNAPIIAAPASRAGSGFRNYVPNNDLDAVGGDLRRIGEIRTPKVIRPRLFDAAEPFVFAWSLDPGEATDGHARTVARIAQRLYQLGRGVDMAWAWAEVVHAAEIGSRFAAYGGAVYRPSESGAGRVLLCPERGSLRSLEDRFRANQKRLSSVVPTGDRLFSQAPKPRFRVVPYDSPPTRLLFDLRATGGRSADPKFAPWPLARAVKLVTIARDGAVARLKNALPGKETLIDRVMIGRDANEADKAARVWIAPLPSIGHAYADHAIRRLLVEVPPNCPIPHEDIEWGFSGLHLGADYRTGELMDEGQPVLMRADDEGMLDHYGAGPRDGVDHRTRVWRTVTPAALPEFAARRRIDPRRLRDPAERKGASALAEEQDRAAGAVIQALRHAGIGTGAAAIRVQREPFSPNGERAESLAPQTRFAKERLWHVEIAFTQPVAGPLIVGDGRYLGLGLMAAIGDPGADVKIFRLANEPHIAIADQTALLIAVRRALMSLSRRSDGSVPRLFSGHEADGAPAQSGRHEHVFLAAADLDRDGRVDRLIVGAPWRCDRAVRRGGRDRALFDRTVSALSAVRAGRLGIVSLVVDAAGAEGGRLVGPSRIWKSHTDYRPTRHAKEAPTAALLRDVVGECERRGLPRPEPKLLRATTDPRGGIAARLGLRFAVAITGPILLGRDSHLGGGLFLAKVPA
jgi:CRISPR-associated protein Csb2